MNRMETKKQNSRRNSKLEKLNRSRIYLYCLIAVHLLGVSSNSRADSCSTASTFISTTVNDGCFLTGAETVTVTPVGVLDTTPTSTIFASGGATGSINNQGTLVANAGSRSVASVHSNVFGDIINNGDITNTATTGVNSGIGILAGFGVVNSINNTGTITATGGIASVGSAGIFNGWSITNGINNLGDIYGLYSGITNYHTGGTIGGINNSGLIEAVSGGSYGILNNGLISNGLVNSGTIIGPVVGVNNVGTITANGSGYAIDNAGGTITNGILNTGTLDGNVRLDTAALILNGASGRVTGSITGGAASSITVGGTFAAEADATVGSIAVNNGAQLNFTANQNWSGSTGFTNTGTVAIGSAANPNVTLTTSSYTQSASGILQVGASSAGNHGRLVVTGTATFAPGARIDIDVANVNTLASNTTLTNIVTAGTLNASTFNITDNSALFNFQLALNGNTLGLNIVSASATSSGVVDAVNEHGLIPARGGATVLDEQVNGTPIGDMANVVNAFGQLSTTGQVARAAAQTLPVNFGTQSIQSVMSSFGRVLSARFGGLGLSAGDELQNKQVWLKPFGSRADQDNKSGAAGFSSDTWGLAAGADAEVSPGSRVGVAYGYAKTSVSGNTDLSGTGQNAGIESHLLALYGNRPVASDLDFIYQADLGINNNKGTRHLSFGGLNRTATSDYQTYTAHIGVGLNKTVSLSEATTLIPGIRADYTHLRSESYSERGADALNLNVNSHTTEALVLGTDARLIHKLDDRSNLNLIAGVGYDTMNKQGSIVSTFSGVPGQSFATPGIDHGPWLARGGIGYSHRTQSGTDIAIRYDAEGRSGFINQTASVKATWAF